MMNAVALPLILMTMFTEQDISEEMLISVAKSSPPLDSTDGWLVSIARDNGIGP